MSPRSNHWPQVMELQAPKLQTQLWARGEKELPELRKRIFDDPLAQEATLSAGPLICVG